MDLEISAKALSLIHKSRPVGWESFGPPVLRLCSTWRDLRLPNRRRSGQCRRRDRAVVALAHICRDALSRFHASSGLRLTKNTRHPYRAPSLLRAHIAPLLSAVLQPETCAREYRRLAQRS